MNATASPLKLTDDDFTLLGLPQRFELDQRVLDARWRELQSRVHPDRFVGQPPQAQRLAMQQSVRVNEAHRRLRDPVRRAAYLCELRGAPIDAERNTAMPREFLLHQMQWREALDEAETPDAVDALAVEVQAVRKDLMQRVAMALDEGGGSADVAAQSVRALMFVERFRDDLDARRHAES